MMYLDRLRSVVGLLNSRPSSVSALFGMKVEDGTETPVRNSSMGLSEAAVALLL